MYILTNNRFPIKIYKRIMVTYVSIKICKLFGTYIYIYEKFKVLFSKVSSPFTLPVTITTKWRIFLLEENFLHKNSQKVSSNLNPRNTKGPSLYLVFTLCSFHWMFLEKIIISLLSLEFNCSFPQADITFRKRLYCEVIFPSKRYYLRSH